MDHDGLVFEDATTADPYELADRWGVEVTATRIGLLALPIKRPITVRQSGPHAEEGLPGDVLLVHNQKMQRHVMTANLFEFLFGEAL